MAGTKTGHGKDECGRYRCRGGCESGETFKRSNKEGIDQICSGKIGEGPNPHKVKFATTQFDILKKKANRMGIMVGDDFEAKTIFCFLPTYPSDKKPDLDQSLIIRRVKTYFYKAIYYSLNGPEQHELIRHLYEDKAPEDGVSSNPTLNE